MRPFGVSRILNGWIEESKEARNDCENNYQLGSRETSTRARVLTIHVFCQRTTKITRLPPRAFDLRKRPIGKSGVFCYRDCRLA
jgi:hypothetical protein